MTSSARASSDGDKSRPRAFAVFMLMTKSNLVGCSTGMSAGFVATQNLINKLSGAPELVRLVRSVRHQTSRFNKLAKHVQSRQSFTDGTSVDLGAVRAHDRVHDDIERVRAALNCLKGRRDIVGAPDIHCGDFQTKRSRRRLNLPHFQHGVGRTNIAQDRQPTQSRNDLAQDL